MAHVPETQDDDGRKQPDSRYVRTILFTDVILRALFKSGPPRVSRLPQRTENERRDLQPGVQGHSEQLPQPFIGKQPEIAAPRA